MKDCATTVMRFDTPTQLAFEATFDGGLPWGLLAQIPSLASARL